MAIYCCLEVEDGREDVFEVIDGKQRLTTVFRFLNGELALKTGERFTDLNPKDRQFFYMQNVNVFRLSVNDYARNLTKQEKLDIFLTINQRGTKLTDADLEKAKTILG